MQPEPAFTRDDVSAFVDAAHRAARTGGVDAHTLAMVGVALAWITAELAEPDPRWEPMRRWGHLAKQELAMVAQPTVMLPLLQMRWP